VETELEAEKIEEKVEMPPMFSMKIGARPGFEIEEIERKAFIDFSEDMEILGVTIRSDIKVRYYAHDMDAGTDLHITIEVHGPVAIETLKEFIESRNRRLDELVRNASKIIGIANSLRRFVDNVMILRLSKEEENAH